MNLSQAWDYSNVKMKADRQISNHTFVFLWFLLSFQVFAGIGQGYPALSTPNQ